MMPKDLLEHLEKGAPGDELEFLRPKPEGRAPHEEAYAGSVDAFPMTGGQLGYAAAMAADRAVRQMMEGNAEAVTYRRWLDESTRKEK